MLDIRPPTNKARAFKYEKSVYTEFYFKKSLIPYHIIWINVEILASKVCNCITRPESEAPRYDRPSAAWIFEYFCEPFCVIFNQCLRILLLRLFLCLDLWVFVSHIDVILSTVGFTD